MTNCTLTTNVKEYLPQAKAIAEQWQLPCHGLLTNQLIAEYPFYLLFDGVQLQLYKSDEPKLKPIIVDFVGGAVDHRRKFGGGRGQEIARAVGLKHGFNPSVLDATAGLGRDAFLLASLGCKVTMVERVAAVAALLDDGLRRGYLDSEIGSWLEQRLQLVHRSSVDNMSTAVDSEQVDVVYLDPMYPHKEKSAQVKKEMRVFQSLVGSDDDADALLAQAQAIAKYRVVVKRPNYAEPLAGKQPSTSIKMKKNRFDIYVNAAIPKREQAD
jgi:16S rRNA (guanine1516-N2)-methyltransferase